MYMYCAVCPSRLNIIILYCLLGAFNIIASQVRCDMSSYSSLVYSFFKLQLLLAISGFVCARSSNVDKGSFARHSYDVPVSVDTQPLNFEDVFSISSLLTTYNSPARVHRAFSVDDVAQGNDSEPDYSQHDNCTDPRDKGSYENTCQFVIAECGKKSELINYLAFALCDLPYLEVRMYPNTRTVLLLQDPNNVLALPPARGICCDGYMAAIPHHTSSNYGRRHLSVTFNRKLFE